jgi:deoxyribonuclease V
VTRPLLGAILVAMGSTSSWPASANQLRLVQHELAAERPPAWRVPATAYTTGGCFVCFVRGVQGRGAAGDLGWAGVALAVGAQIVGSAVVQGPAGDSYEPGLLALREGPLLEAAVRTLARMPDVLLVNATGRDHPRRAGLAVQLGAMLELPTVGVTHRPLLAGGDWPPDQAGARSPLQIGEEEVGCWLRTRPRARPLAVHPGWRTSLDTACAVVLATVGWVRTPEPLREARRVARRARARLAPTRTRPVRGGDP